MFIYPQKDGSATWSGSFNQAQWDAYESAVEARAAKGKAAKAEPKPSESEPAKKAAAHPPAKKGSA